MAGEVRFPYEEFRRGQKELAEQVRDTVLEGKVLVVRAPTGFGKTASIIYGLLLAGADRVLYLVRTVNEINPVVRELRRFSVDFSFLFSARRACPLMGARGRPPPPEDFWENCRLARLRGICEYYRRVEEVEPGEVLRLVREGGHVVGTAWRLAEELGVCPFFALLKAGREAGFIVATYPYLFRPDIFEGVMDPYTYEDFVVVVDEAHTLVSAHSLLEQRVKRSDLEAAAREVEEYAPQARLVRDSLLEAARRLKQSTPRVLKRPVRLDKEQVLEVLGDLELLLDAAEEVRSRKFEEALAGGGDPGRVRASITRVAQWASVLALDYSFLFAEPGEEEPSYVAAPMDPGLVAGPPLSRARAVILASGTLPEGDFVRELLGVDREVVYVDTEVLYGRFLPSRNLYTVVARDVTSRYRERTREMYRRLAAYVAAISRGLPGLKLFVYPSYEFMENVLKSLPVEVEAIVEERGTSLDDVEEAIRERPEAGVHAVAGGKLVEGVEFADEEGRNLLHTVAVVGVPYPQPDDYTRTQLEVLEARIGSSRARYYVYEFSTVVRVRQALGRATRSPEDRAVYFLLDYRYMSKPRLMRMLGVPLRRIVDLQGLPVALEEARRHLYPSSSR